MLHISQVRKILLSKKPFDCKVWKKNGEILNYKNVVCTSTYFRNDTATLLFINSRQIRTVIIVSIFEINDEEVFI